MGKLERKTLLNNTQHLDDKSVILIVHLLMC